MRNAVRQFATTASRSVLSISFLQKNAYANKPILEEQIRREIGDFLQQTGTWNSLDGGFVEIKPPGPHYGGPRGSYRGLHSSCIVSNKHGKVVATVLVPHSETVWSLMG